MKIERFEDIQAWQEARVLANLIYDVTDKDAFAKDYGLKNQVREAAGSVMHNIAEGFDVGSDNEFIPFLKYARRSASEVQSEAHLALDRHYLTSEQFRTIHAHATMNKKLINAFSAYSSPRSQETKRLVDHTTIRPPDHQTK